VFVPFLSVVTATPLERVAATVFTERDASTNGQMHTLDDDSSVVFPAFL